MKARAARIGICCLFATLLAMVPCIAQEKNQGGFVPPGYAGAEVADAAPLVVRIFPVTDDVAEQLMTEKKVEPDEVPKCLSGELRHVAAFFEYRQVSFPGDDRGWFHPGMEVMIVYTTPSQAEVIGMMLAGDGTGEEKRISTQSRLYVTGAGGKGVARESKCSTETKPGQRMEFTVLENGLLQGTLSLASRLDGTRHIRNDLYATVTYKDLDFKLTCSTRTPLKTPQDYLLGATAEGEEIHLDIRQEIGTRKVTAKIDATRIAELEKALTAELEARTKSETMKTKKEDKDAQIP